MPLRNTHLCVDEITRQIFQFVQRQSGSVYRNNFACCAELEEESDFRSSHDQGWEGFSEMGEEFGEDEGRISFSCGKSFLLKFSRLSEMR